MAHPVIACPHCLRYIGCKLCEEGPTDHSPLYVHDDVHHPETFTAREQLDFLSGAHEFLATGCDHVWLPRETYSRCVKCNTIVHGPMDMIIPATYHRRVKDQ